MLKTKIGFILLLVILVIAIYFYYIFDKSYVLSAEAKKYYGAGDFKEASELAQKAYDLNTYNRMAFTVLVQSQESLKWKKYIDETKKYLDFVEAVSYKEAISKSDLIRIKMICEISMANYEKLNQNNMMIDPFLKKDATRLHKEILAIRDELFK
jgi:hypothetical protein